MKKKISAVPAHSTENPQGKWAKKLKFLGENRLTLGGNDFWHPWNVAKPVKTSKNVGFLPFKFDPFRAQGQPLAKSLVLNGKKAKNLVPVLKNELIKKALRHSNT